MLQSNFPDFPPDTKPKTTTSQPKDADEQRFRKLVTSYRSLQQSLEFFNQNNSIPEHTAAADLLYLACADQIALHQKKLDTMSSRSSFYYYVLEEVSANVPMKTAFYSAAQKLKLSPPTTHFTYVNSSHWHADVTLSFDQPNPTVLRSTGTGPTKVSSEYLAFQQLLFHLAP
jgi:hypothetical protein